MTIICFRCSPFPYINKMFIYVLPYGIVVEPSPIQSLAADCLIFYFFDYIAFRRISFLRCSNKSSKDIPAIKRVIITQNFF